MAQSVFPGYPKLTSDPYTPQSTQSQTPAPLYPTLPSAPSHPEATAPLYPTLQPTTPPYNQALLDAYNNNDQLKLNPAYYNPMTFREGPNQRVEYLMTQPKNQGIKKNNHSLDNLKIYLDKCLNGFNPWEFNLTHPIHNELKSICTPLLAECKTLPWGSKRDYLSEAIAEIVWECNDIPDQKVASKLPKFELLEITLRFHLYLGLIDQEKAAITTFVSSKKKVPDNIDQIGLGLHQFVTNMALYSNPYPDMYTNLTKEAVEPLLDESLAKTTVTLPLEKGIDKSEKFIQSKLKSMALSSASNAAYSVDAYLRNGMGSKWVLKLAEHYNKEFQEAGTINIEQLNKDVLKLEEFLTNHGKIYPSWNLKVSLIANIFGLDLKSRAPFCAVRAKLIQEQTEKVEALETPSKNQIPKLLQWVPFVPAAKTKEQLVNAINALAAKQQETVDAMEKEVALLMLPPPVQPSAPPQIDPSSIAQGPTVVSIPLVETTPTPPHIFTPIVLPPQPEKNKEIPSISYVDIAFEDLLKNRSDNDKWLILPLSAQKDVLRHVHYQPRLKGEAEDAVRRTFDGIKIWSQLQIYNRKAIPPAQNGLDGRFVSEGQALLDFYYSDKSAGQYHNFLNRFQALQKNPLFYQYVYEMAVKANVYIESWDHNFAEYNWDKPQILPLSIQALERCLHAERKKN